MIYKPFYPVALIYLIPLAIGLVGFRWSCKIKGVQWDFRFMILMVFIPVINILTALKILSISVNRYA